ncbi:hypothetical protein OPT61_g872 [Boeremia exigua]|uniref:Uncharacterized protein n=1 Tax=Boeremia exigua TaxID=749465 RepID=A0ACC2ISE1_9PLEO|nr:hypothetical protein OPT61_g872 [Boeremia exigua]
MGAETRVVKRKRSLDELAVGSSRTKTLKAVSRKPALARASIRKALRSRASIRKALRSRAVPPEPTTTTSESSCPLIQTLREYGLLETVASCLVPDDLLALALSCKATYNAMFPCAESLDNLLSKMPCSGSGIALRQNRHRKSSFFYEYPCAEFAQCRTASGRRNIDSNPCVSCRVTTCDECRIHCVYQTTYEAPSDPEDLPNFSGFVLLDPHEVGILSPDHLGAEVHSDSSPNLHAWRDRATDAAAGPYHDQGFLDLPLQFDQAGTPERIRDVIDVDLGRHSLTTWSGTSQFGFPSPVLRSLCNVTEQRKLSLCEHCFTDAPKGYKALTPELPELGWLDALTDGGAETALRQCHCSLRSRILDRWQCVKCYAKEEATIQDLNVMAAHPEPRQCRCGLIPERIVCLWCWGEVTEESDAIEHAGSEASSSDTLEAESPPEEE